MSSKYTPLSNTDEEGGNGGGDGVITNIDETILNNDNDDEISTRNELLSRIVVDTNCDDENVHNDDDLISDALHQHDGINNHNSGNETTTTTPSQYRLYNQIFRQTFITDDTIKLYGGIILIENTFAMKLFKFTIFTFLSIWTMFYFVRFMGWEHDVSLTLSDVWRYEGNLIVTDVMFFYVVGRLYKQRGIDHLEWIVWCIAANIYSSFITDFKMFQHSFTLYEMHCKWPWQLWIFTILVIPLIITISFLHLQYAWKKRIVVQKCLEIIFCNTFLLLPLITSSYFHLHHWFAGLLIGMHFNFDVWWSRAAMAWCWGCYINGIAVYGRDPVLTCAYAYFMSTTQRCPFIHCYLEALSTPTHVDENNNTVTPMIPPDWRNCSSDAFHP